MNKVNWIADYMVTALGCGTDTNAQAILNYKSGIKPHNIGENHFIAAPISWEDIPMRADSTKLESLMIFAIENLKKQVNKDLSQAQIIFSTTKGNIDLLATDGALSEPVYLSKMAERVNRFAKKQEAVSLRDLTSRETDSPNTSEIVADLSLDLLDFDENNEFLFGYHDLERIKNTIDESKLTAPPIVYKKDDGR